MKIKYLKYILFTLVLGLLLKVVYNLYKNRYAIEEVKSLSIVESFTVPVIEYSETYLQTHTEYYLFNVKTGYFMGRTGNESFNNRNLVRWKRGYNNLTPARIWIRPEGDSMDSDNVLHNNDYIISFSDAVYSHSCNGNWGCRKLNIGSEYNGNPRALASHETSDELVNFLVSPSSSTNYTDDDPISLYYNYSIYNNAQDKYLDEGMNFNYLDNDGPTNNTPEYYWTNTSNDKYMFFNNYTDIFSEYPIEEDSEPPFVNIKAPTDGWINAHNQDTDIIINNGHYLKRKLGVGNYNFEIYSRDTGVQFKKISAWIGDGNYNDSDITTLVINKIFQHNGAHIDFTSDSFNAPNYNITLEGGNSDISYNNNYYEAIISLTDEGSKIINNENIYYNTILNSTKIVIPFDIGSEQIEEDETTCFVNFTINIQRSGNNDTFWTRVVKKTPVCDLGSMPTADDCTASGGILNQEILSSSSSGCIGSNYTCENGDGNFACEETCGSGGGEGLVLSGSNCNVFGPRFVNFIHQNDTPRYSSGNDGGCEGENLSFDLPEGDYNLNIYQKSAAGIELNNVKIEEISYRWAYFDVEDVASQILYIDENTLLEGEGSGVGMSLGSGSNYAIGNSDTAIDSPSETKKIIFPFKVDSYVSGNTEFSFNITTVSDIDNSFWVEITERVTIPGSNCVYSEWENAGDCILNDVNGSCGVGTIPQTRLFTGSSVGSDTNNENCDSPEFLEQPGYCEILCPTDDGTSVSETQEIITSWPKKTFRMSNENCRNPNEIEQNGCFNKFPNRIEKCENIRKYFKEHPEVLSNWTDFQNECGFLNINNITL